MAELKTGCQPWRVIESQDATYRCPNVRDDSVICTELLLDAERDRDQCDPGDGVWNLRALDVSGPTIPVCQKLCAGSQSEIRPFPAGVAGAKAETAART